MWFFLKIHSLDVNITLEEKGRLHMSIYSGSRLWIVYYIYISLSFSPKNISIYKFPPLSVDGDVFV